MTIKRQKPTQGAQIKVKQDVIEVDYFNHPVFCFRHLHKDYCLDHCTHDEKRSLIDQIVRMSRLDWRDLQLAPRHGMGSEKISVDSIKAEIPYPLTENVKHLLAFRFDGKKPFIGFRNKFIFHVLFIDREYKLYHH